jgi:tetratricopeptide (TPR) repeat protein
VKKHKQPQLVDRPLSERIATARQQRQTQLALDLTRQLSKQQPTEEHQELLRQVTLERGRDLQERGMTKDAATVYANLLTMGGTPEFQAVVAERLAGCGAVTPALALIEQLPDPAARQKILGKAVDAALAQGAKGKSGLPAELHAAFDLIVQAFAHAEAGRDEDARTALQGIGLQSPFLEWKVLLRGLLAYYAKDDPRAIENWQRLDPNRLPFRLSVTLRSAIDPAFLAIRSPDVQKTLREKIAQLQGGNFAAMLRELGKLLAKENLTNAFRKAENIVKLLRPDHTVLIPRLAQCFFWAILDHGEPEDLIRYRRTFGASSDDPQLFRLEALALETRGLWPEAHKAWQNFIEHVAKTPQTWPGAVGTRTQAIVWARMAENASPHRKRRGSSGNPFFDMFNDEPGPLKPTAEQCYEKAIKLAPDRLDSYIALFNLYREDHKLPKAKKLGQELLKRFPAHADTLEALGELHLETKDYQSAQEYFEQSLRANPLDRTLRGKLARARQKFGLALTIAKKYAQAREQYEQSLQLWDGAKTSLLCQWAIAEMKAGEADRAAALIAQAQADPDQRLACRYALVGESVRAKLSAKEKKQIALDLKTALAQTPTPAEILVLIEGAAHQRLTHDEVFHGQKTQEKTILKFLDQLKFTDFDERQLERLCTGLMTLQARKPWMNCLTQARRKHLHSVFFRLSYADYYLTERNAERKTHLAREHLDAARRLIEGLPRGEQQQQYLEQIKEKEAIIAKLDAGRPEMFSMMERMFESFGGEYDDDDDDLDDGW